MKPEANLSFAIMGITVAFLIIYDIWIIFKRGYSDTISWTLFAWSKRYPIIPFAIGVVIGHLFWNVEIDGNCP